MRKVALAFRIFGWVSRPAVFLLLLAIVVFCVMFEHLVMMGQLAECWKESGNLTDFSAVSDPEDHPVF